jgi:hypothetical protein
MISKMRKIIFLTIALGFLLICCTQNNKENLTYTNTEQGFSIAVPEGMTQSTEVQPNEFILRFRDKAPPADRIIMVEVISLPPEKQSLEDFSREVHDLYLSRAGREGRENASGSITLSGVPTQWFQIYAKGHRQEAIMDHYVLVYNMKGYVISHFTLADRYDSDKAEAEMIIKSFQLLIDREE